MKLRIRIGVGLPIASTVTLLQAGCVYDAPPPPIYRPAPVVVRPPSPPVVVETPPPPPVAHPYWVWHRGHWQWDGYRWVWIRGRYSERFAY